MNSTNLQHMSSKGNRTAKTGGQVQHPGDPLQRRHRRRSPAAGAVAGAPDDRFN